MNRRDFVVRGTGAVAALGVGTFGAAEPARAERSPSVLGRLPYRVIVDQRFPEARAFGYGAAQLGCTIQPISGDVTSLWFNELQPLWARGEGEIVGMTTGASLMCLEQLAWNQWMRVVARVDHRAESDGTVRHRLILRNGPLQEAQVALAENGPWAGRMAVTLVKWLGNHQDGPPLERVALTRPRSREPSGTSLTSWVIAARSTQVTSIRAHCAQLEDTPI
jgi:hypothetical protein